MANKNHLDILMRGAEVWNRWRAEHPELTPDLAGAKLSGMNLVDANLATTNLDRANLSRANLSAVRFNKSRLRRANLSGANLSKAILSVTDLSGADLSGAHLVEAYLNGANLSGAVKLREADMRGAQLTNAVLPGAILERTKLGGADLSYANLTRAKIVGANLSKARLHRTDLTGAKIIDSDLQRADLVQTKLEKATISNCQIYGVNVWNLTLNKTKQRDLVITRPDESVITVDDLEVAQFIYLLLNNQKFKNVIDAVTSKGVLLLGRFTPERKLILDRLREHLRARGYLPILFDFDRPANQTIEGTVTTLARLARFIIADITDPKSIPQELTTIVRNLPTVPVMPILKRGDKPWSMYDHIRMYPWVLPLHKYDDLDGLLDTVKEKVIGPAEAMVKQIEKKYRAVDEELRSS